ncbi:MAG: permease [Gemmatimonadetes bacterium]|nr:MAG: permease [Gemmatimonadota bacterium]
MSLWRQIARGLRALTHRPAADREVADEVQHYLEQATAAHLARGLPPAEALRAARLEMGSMTSVREAVRGQGWENAVETLLADLRYAARRLRSAPGFTAITVLTLAVGIGGTSAIFSAVNPILFQPPPYPEAGRIAMVWEAFNAGGRQEGTYGMYAELKDRARSLESIAVLRPWEPTMTGPAQPERFAGQRVSASYFHVLGVSPSLGRDFDAAEDRFGGPRVVILGDAVWRRRFGADSAIIGRSIVLDGDPWVVIGVMPRSFENVLAPQAGVWAPLQHDLTEYSWGHHLRTVARLKPGIPIAQASREVDALGRALAKQHTDSYGPRAAFAVHALQDDLTRGIKPALLAILAAVTLVLLIACVNVTNLLLARGVQRRAEFALRAALGAGRKRLVRQLLTESLALATLGGALGAVVAALGVRALVALAPSGLPRVGAIAVNGPVLAFDLVLTTLIGLAFGVFPALQAARSDPGQELQHGSRRMVGGHRKTRGALVVAEVALALVLLVGSGLLLRSLRRLFAIDSGFDGSHLLTMEVQVAGHRYDADGATVRFFEQALEAVRGVPGVSTAALTSQLPLSGDLDEYGVHVELNPTDRVEAGSTFRYGVSPGYIETMRIPLRKGRVFDERDRSGAPPAALVSESFARTVLKGADPIGRRMRIGPPTGDPYTVVGVVGDVRQVSLALSEANAIYIPESQWHFDDNPMSLVVRTRGDAAALAPAIRRAIWSVDKDQPIVRVAMMDDLLAATAAERRFALILFEAFGLAALVLAAAGIYGVLSGSVAERTREIGVRAALGASRKRILALVLGQGLGLAAAGIAIGLLGAAVATRALIAMLFGVSRLDPVTYLAVIGLLAAVSVLACAVPAWRAARVDPARTLRMD